MVFWFTTLLTNVSALKITEIESNPEGDDSGFEWIELYSESNVNLEGYILDHDGRGSAINLSGSFDGYYILELQTQWLRNSNETVYLKNGENIVETVGPFTDNKKDKTYSLCDGEWIFSTETKEEENSCRQKPNTQTNTNNNNNPNVNEEIEEEEESKEKSKKNSTIPIIQNLKINNTIEEDEPAPKKKILLNQKSEDEKVEYTKTYRTREIVIYFFIGFSALLVILIAFRKL